MSLGTRIGVFLKPRAYQRRRTGSRPCCGCSPWPRPTPRDQAGGRRPTMTRGGGHHHHVRTEHPRRLCGGGRRQHRHQCWLVKCWADRRLEHEKLIAQRPIQYMAGPITRGGHPAQDPQNGGGLAESQQRGVETGTDVETRPEPPSGRRQRSKVNGQRRRPSGPMGVTHRGHRGEFVGPPAWRNRSAHCSPWGPPERRRHRGGQGPRRRWRTPPRVARTRRRG